MKNDKTQFKDDGIVFNYKCGDGKSKCKCFQKVTDDGKCEDCPLGQLVGPDGKKCVTKQNCQHPHIGKIQLGRA